MSAESLVPASPLSRDHDLSMGQRLMQLERRQQLLTMLKTTIVWIVLITLLVLALIALQVNPGKVINNADEVFKGVWITIGISLASILCASVLAFFGALGRLSTNVIAQGISSFYITVIRGTPLLIQVLIIYQGLPRIANALIDLGFPFLGRLLILDPIPSGILALSLNYGAYMTEIFRAGLQSIGVGQQEAALALGLTRWQLLSRIILPQAVRIIIPDVGNQFIAMQKDSSLVYILGVWEVTFLARQVAKREVEYMGIYLLAAFIYLMLTVVSSWLQSRLEQRMAHAYER
jgi:polar amino acid transport system permease protein